MIHHVIVTLEGHTACCALKLEVVSHIPWQIIVWFIFSFMLFLVFDQAFNVWEYATTGCALKCATILHFINFGLLGNI